MLLKRFDAGMKLRVRSSFLSDSHFSRFSIICMLLMARFKYCNSCSGENQSVACIYKNAQSRTYFHPVKILYLIYYVVVKVQSCKVPASLVD